MARRFNFSNWYEIELISTTNKVLADSGLLNTAIDYTDVVAATGFQSMLVRVLSCAFRRENSGDVFATFGQTYGGRTVWSGKFNVRCLPFSLDYTDFWSNEKRADIERFLSRKNLYIRVRPSGTVGGVTVTKPYPTGYDNVFTFDDFGNNTYLFDDTYCYPVILETVTQTENDTEGWRELEFTLVLRSKLPNL